MPIGVVKDDVHYLIFARAHAFGDGCRYTNLPGAPAAAHFPPGFPLLLAPLWWVVPRLPANMATTYRRASPVAAARTPRGSSMRTAREARRLRCPC